MTSCCFIAFSISLQILGVQVPCFASKQRNEVIVQNKTLESGYHETNDRGVCFSIINYYEPLFEADYNYGIKSIANQQRAQWAVPFKIEIPVDQLQGPTNIIVQNHFGPYRWLSATNNFINKNIKNESAKSYNIPLNDHQTNNNSSIYLGNNLNYNTQNSFEPNQRISKQHDLDAIIEETIDTPKNNHHRPDTIINSSHKLGYNEKMTKYFKADTNFCFGKNLNNQFAQEEMTTNENKCDSCLMNNCDSGTQGQAAFQKGLASYLQNKGLSEPCSISFAPKKIKNNNDESSVFSCCKYNQNSSERNATSYNLSNNNKNMACTNNLKEENQDPLDTERSMIMNDRSNLEISTVNSNGNSKNDSANDSFIITNLPTITLDCKQINSNDKKVSFNQSNCEIGPEYIQLHSNGKITVNQFKIILYDVANNIEHIRVLVPGEKSGPLDTYFQHIEQDKALFAYKNGVVKLSNGFLVPLKTVISIVDFYKWLLEQYIINFLTFNIPQDVVNTSSNYNSNNLKDYLINFKLVNVVMPNSHLVPYLECKSYLDSLPNHLKEHVLLEILGCKISLASFEHRLKFFHENGNVP